MLEVAIQKRLGSFALRATFSTAGELLVLFGPSGSGKTLTLQCLAGIARPDSGRIAIDGQAVYDAFAGIDIPPQRRRVAYVPQSYALFPHLTVAENIAYGLHRLKGDVARRRAAEVVAALRLTGLEQRRPHQLSGGEQQRVAVARALVTRPRLLVLDEPFSALDQALRGRLRSDLQALRREFGIDVVLVTHDLSEAQAVGDSVAVYAEGQVLQVGAVRDVFHRPSSPTVARLTGNPNVFVGRITAASPEGVTLQAQAFVVEAPPGPYAVGQWVAACIRPEYVVLLRRARAGEAAGHVGHRRSTLLEGEVVWASPQGPFYSLGYHVDGSTSPLGYDLEATLPAHAYEELGLRGERRWRVALRWEAVHIIGQTSPPPAPAPAPR